MKHFLFLVLLFVLRISHAQNLVSNWSFEDTIYCPTAIGQVDGASGWSSFRQSPDYFNSCNASNLGVPTNFAGFQQPHTGNAYVGFATYFIPSVNQRESLGSQLNQPLIIGQKYFLSFFICRAVNNLFYFNIATNKIGARFSTVGFSGGNPVPIDNYSQIYSDSIILDTLNWVKIVGSFIADSVYEYLSFGNFFVDSATSISILDSTAYFSYYYIDDIRLSTDSAFVNGIAPELNLLEEVKLFPNPATNQLSVSSAQLKLEVVTLYGMLGEKIMEYLNLGGRNEYRLPVDYLSPGLYFIQVMTNKGVVTLKWVKS